MSTQELLPSTSNEKNEMSEISPELIGAVEEVFKSDIETLDSLSISPEIEATYGGLGKVLNVYDRRGVPR